MKTIKTWLTAMAVLLCSISASAHHFEVEGFFYNFTSQTTVEVTYNGPVSYYVNDEYVGDIVIPEKVTYNGITYHVTQIGEEAFYKCRSLTSIVIPQSVTSIKSGAFSGCEGLSAIEIPNSVVEIGKNAFAYCSNLTSITIPKNVKSIGGDAFYGTPWYEALPDGEVYIGDVLYKYKGTMPENTTIDVREGTVSISEEAFWSCKNLIAITIPNSVVEIGKDAFAFCSNLTSITIPKNVKSIGGDAFYGTPWYEALPDGEVYFGKVFYKYKGAVPVETSVEIKEGTTSISDHAFSGAGIVSIIVPEGVVSIGDGAFNISTLTNITIPQSVKSIGLDVFSHNSALKKINLSSIETWLTAEFTGSQSIPFYYGADLYVNGELVTDLVIPNTVPVVKDYSFSYFKGLKSVTVSDGVKRIETNVFRECTNLTTVAISESVSWLGGGSFSGCSSLTDIYIPSKIEALYAEMFALCSNLKSVTCTAVVPPSVTHPNGAPAQGGQFYNVPLSECTLYVPEESIDAYKSANKWSEFGQILPIVKDLEIFDNQESFTQDKDENCASINYTRNFTNTAWQSLYVPFEIPVTEDLLADFEIADLNDIRQYDRNDDGVKDETVVEAFKVKSGATLAANYPYLIRAKEAGEKTITVTDATLFAAEEVSIDCSSIREKFTFTGTYSRKEANELGGCYALCDGVWQPLAADATLGAFRVYLKIESRNSNEVPAQAIRIRVIGEDDATAIDEMESSANGQQLTVVYDLQGRRIVNADNLKGVYIINGKKVVK